MALDLRSAGRGFDFQPPPLGCIPGQVVRTCTCLCLPPVLIWHRRKLGR